MKTQGMRKSLSRSVLGALTGLITLLALSNCTPNNFQSSGNSSLLNRLGTEQDIFSTRSQSNQFIAIVKLSTPSLLESAKKDPKTGLLEQNPELLKQLLTEQELAVAAFKDISPDIKVLYKYKFVLNAIAIVAPTSVKDKIQQLAQVSYIENSGDFSRPQIFKSESAAIQEDINAKNSVKFIGADKVHDLKVKDANGKEVSVDGTGMRVGIIDTGIDYTHAMFGGAGTPEAYKAIDPSKPYAGFPTQKVVGGIDLVGTDYDSASADFSKHIPLPDENPLDEAGHGSHVAGTVAGVGDGVNTYSGVAPGAKLYAIKVFGANGSTGDAIVIAAFEYAANPEGTTDLNKELDAVNLSLGGDYGNPHVLYDQAIKNLTKGGTVVVCAAGNAGPSDYIVGAPGTSEEAISVAASIDNGLHNWQFASVKFVTPKAGDLVAEAIEGNLSKPIADAGNVVGPLVAVGLANVDLGDEAKLAIKGKVALIDRGADTFENKIRRASDAGAVGVVVVNNVDGDPISMGGETQYPVPAVMIRKDLGDTLKEQMKLGDVLIHFQNDQKILKPQLIDTLTSFSSKGPRSIDGLIKPEISAPGSDIISAAMGKGNLGVKFSGTSMATPHMAGVVTLLKQYRPNLSVAEIKALVMGQAKQIGDIDKKQYSVSMQGAGRVQALESAQATLVSLKPDVSLGELNLETQKVVRDTVTLENLGSKDLTLSVSFAGSPRLQLSSAQTISVAAGQSKDLELSFAINGAGLEQMTEELDGFVKLSSNGKVVLTVPVLAVVTKVSRIQASNLIIHSTSAADSDKAAADVLVKNYGANPGEVVPFNLLGTSRRKVDPYNDENSNKACALEAAGYRLLKKDNRTLLQVAIKLYEPLTTWNDCDVSVLVNKTGDGLPDQELAGTSTFQFQATGPNLFSVLMDAGVARQLRKVYENAVSAGNTKAKLDYVPALIAVSNFITYNNGTVGVVETDASLLAKSDTGELNIQVATSLNDGSGPEADDFLEKDQSQWDKISVDENSQGYVGLPESVVLKPGEEQTLKLTKGYGHQDLLLLMPENKTVFSDLINDNQAQVLQPKYQ